MTELEIAMAVLRRATLRRIRAERKLAHAQQRLKRVQNRCHLQVVNFARQDKKIEAARFMQFKLLQFERN